MDDNRSYIQTIAPSVFLDHRDNGPLYILGDNVSYAGNTSSSSENFTIAVDPFFQTLKDTASVVLPICYVIVLLVGVLGNSLVLYVILANKSLRTCPNMLFLNLAVADLLFLLFVVPLETAVNVSQWELQLGDGLCKMLKYTTFVTMAVSAYSLAAICVFRCRAIVSPIRASKYLKRRHAACVSFLIWLLMLASNVPVAMYHREVAQCAPVPETDFQFYLLLSVFSGVDFILPLTITAVATAIIVYQLRQNRPVPENKSLSSAGYNRRLIVLVVTVTAIFVVCWGPFHVIIILKSLWLHGMATHAWVVASIVSLFMGYANSCINPIIYNFVSREFRKAFLRTWTRCTPARQRRNDQTLTSFKSFRTTSFNVREQQVNIWGRTRSTTSSTKSSP
ncbi:allatostatin-A receptor [Lingula anatina]|uniref:Allatostatin-A receptor n=1 Tax=Lingula anatina TaxID=7574 RepID=A0A1S3HHD7_LINAN|nr:allatostatin-A receptor [Lingula anatina]|eukprot:XP_013384424.2 allatostatin-A receptor [Lingula anatina]